MKTLEQACIIDDDSIYSYLMSKRLREVNFCKEILIFENGLDALEDIIRKCESGIPLPPVIFLDLNMPVMDGWTFLENYENIEKCDNEHVLIYIITSSIASRDRERVSDFKKIKNYIVKPITKDELYQILETTN